MSAEHRECRKILRERAKALGAEVEVSVVPLAPMDAPHPPESFICPHNITYWIQPTVAQIEQWQRDGTP